MLFGRVHRRWRTAVITRGCGLTEASCLCCVVGSRRGQAVAGRMTAAAAPVGPNRRRRLATRAWAIACTFLLTALVSTGIQPPHGRAIDLPGFGAEMNLSNAAGRSVRPAVATVGDNVYVVWQDAMARLDGSQGFAHILLRRSTDQGLTFEPPQQLDLGTGVSYFPSIAAVDSYVYVVW